MRGVPGIDKTLSKTAVELRSVFSRSFDDVQFRTGNEDTMHKDEVKGAANKAKGQVKEAAGKMTGDRKMQAEGKADQAKGEFQKTAGKVKDAARDALKH